MALYLYEECLAHADSTTPRKSRGLFLALPLPSIFLNQLSLTFLTKKGWEIPSTTKLSYNVVVISRHKDIQTRYNMLLPYLLQKSNLTIKQNLQSLLSNPLQVDHLDRYGPSSALISTPEDLTRVTTSKSFGRIVAIVLNPFSKGFGKWVTGLAVTLAHVIITSIII